MLLLLLMRDDVVVDDVVYDMVADVDVDDNGL